MIRQAHDVAHALSLELLTVVQAALRKEQAGNVRHEFYHLCRRALLAYAEKLRDEQRRLHPVRRSEEPIRDELLQDVSLAAATAVQDVLCPLAPSAVRDEARRVIVEAVAASILIYLAKAEDAA